MTSVSSVAEHDSIPHCAAIILCAGRGTRMGTTRIPKVCLPVAGKPAVNRTIQAYRECGVRTNVIVVGADAGELVRIVGSEFPDALFAYQKDPLGTGDAVVKGARPLLDAGFDGAIFVSVGDKVMDASAVGAVLKRFRESGAEIALAVTSKPESSDMGRLVFDESGEPLGVVEAIEFRLAKLYGRLRELARRKSAVEASELRALCVDELGAEKHLKRLGPLGKVIESGRRIRPGELQKRLPQDAGMVRIGRKRLSYEQAMAGPPYMNESLYLFKASALARGLELLARQKSLREARGQEWYFTDVLHLLAQSEGARIEPVALDHRKQLIFGFNTPGQLMELEEIVRRREGRAQKIAERRPLSGMGRRALKPAAEWIELFRARSPAVMRPLRQIYGADASRLESKRAAYLGLLRLFARRFGATKPAVIARAPGSLNLMGRHIDTEGGFINVMTIDREAIFIAGARGDDEIRLIGGTPLFNDIDFTIGGELAALDWDDWLQYVSSVKVRQMVAGSRDERGNYVKAAALRLQHRFNEMRLGGMDCVAGCDIPSAAGLGASGAIVAAVTEAMAALNGLQLSGEELTRLSAEGEWYVNPSVSGADHVASRLDVNRVAHLRFHPLEIERVVQFPSDWRVRLHCEDTTPPARDGLDFRHRQEASLRLALLLLKVRFPRIEHLLERIRDLSPQRLGVRLSELYEMMLALPERIAPRELLALFPQAHYDKAKELMATHEAPKEYRLREIALFGAAECARSEAFASFLEAADKRAVGEMIAVSHDAERASRTASGDDARLKQLIGDLSSEDPERVRRAQLCMQPGRYGSSTAKLDAIADAVAGAPGVIGAQLSGTGQGGCVMVVAEASGAPCFVLQRGARAGKEAVQRFADAAMSEAVSVPGAGLFST